MKRIKYVVIGIILGLVTFSISGNLYGSYYKNDLFKTKECGSFLLSINTKEREALIKLDEVIKRNAKDNYSIVIDNNAGIDDEGNVYNYYPINGESEHRVITSELVNYYSDYELRTGDGILFDPTPTHPITIRSVDLETTSEYAIITLNALSQEELRGLREELLEENLNDVTEIEEVFYHGQSSNFFVLPEHSLVMLLLILFAMLIIKDINVRIKEVSLRKLEGQSTFDIYCRFVLLNIVVTVFSLVLTSSMLILLKYRVSPRLVSQFYWFLFGHVIFIVIAFFVLTIMGSVLISKTNINLSMKGFQQLEYSIIALMLIKIALLIMLVVTTSSNYINLFEGMSSEMNYKRNLKKYENYYIVDSSYSENVNQSEEIKSISDEIRKYHDGFMTICIPEDIENFSKDNNGIFYVVSGNRDRIILDQNSTLSEQQISMLNYYNLANINVEHHDLKSDRFIYCPKIKGNIYSEPLFFSNYSLTIIELKDMYDYDLYPSYLIFKAESLSNAVSIIEETYKDRGLENHLIVKSLEEVLRRERMFAHYDLATIIKEFFVILILLFILNREIINNFNAYSKEELLELISLGKTKRYMMRKYISFTLLIYTLLVVILMLAQMKLYATVNYKVLVFLMLIEILSIGRSMMKLSYRKVKGI